MGECQYGYDILYLLLQDEASKIAPNIINRNFTANASNQKWTTDVTQINIGSTKLYLDGLIIHSDQGCNINIMDIENVLLSAT